MRCEKYVVVVYCGAFLHSCPLLILTFALVDAVIAWHASFPVYVSLSGVSQNILIPLSVIFGHADALNVCRASYRANVVSVDAFLNIYRKIIGLIAHVVNA